MSRALHVILSTIPHWLSYFIEDSIILHYLRCSSYIVMMTLPLQWVMGILPPFEPLILWAMEQTQVFLLGGTPTPSLNRSWGQMAISIMHLGILAPFHQNQWLVSILCGITGYVLSLDWFGLFDKNQRKSVSGISSPINYTIKSKMMGKSVIMVQSRAFLIGKEILTHIFFFSINLLMVMINTPSFDKTKQNETGIESLDNSSMSSVNNSSFNSTQSGKS